MTEKVKESRGFEYQCTKCRYLGKASEFEIGEFKDGHQRLKCPKCGNAYGFRG